MMSFIVFIKNFTQLMGLLSTIIDLIKKDVDAKEIHKAVKSAVDTGDTSDLERLLNDRKK